MRTKFLFLGGLVLCVGWLVQAQSPAPVIVPAQTTTTVAPAVPPSPATGDDSVQSAIKLLEEVRAANAETLKKQQAALERLDELQKAADQLKVYAKRS